VTRHRDVLSIWRTVLALGLAPCLVVSSAAAPEHIHEADAHHARAVVHRHLEPHHHDGLEGPHDHDRAEFSQEEGRVVWLDQVGIQAAIYRLAVAQVVAPVYFAARPEPGSWIVASILDGAPPHGPPRQYTSLRAPPSFG
jgi:hypothetical protein